MLKINTEYRRGILFIRLKGRFDNKCFIETIDYLINDLGISSLVLNLIELEYISLENIDILTKKIQIY